MEEINRFLEVQKNSYPEALEEIKCGRKETHWMWYIFPQIVGLGESSISNYYAIQSIEEAREYISNEELKNHLMEITKELLRLKETNIEKILGPIDSLKLKSSMTLFQLVDQEEDIYQQVLDKFYQGEQRIIHV